MGSWILSLLIEYQIFTYLLVLETSQLCEPLRFDVAQPNLSAKIEKSVETALIESR